MIIKYRSLVNDDLGSPDGVLIFDESGFVKKSFTIGFFFMMSFMKATDFQVTCHSGRG